jgi:hypothetical protein
MVAVASCSAVGTALMRNSDFDNFRFLTYKEQQLVVQQLLQLTCSSHADHMQLLVRAHVTLS